MKIQYLLHRFPIILILIVAILCSSCFRFSEIKKQLDNPRSVEQQPQKVMAENLDMRSASDRVRKDIQEQLFANKLEEIDKAANEARLKKERLEGGYWKLDTIYEGVSGIYAEYPGQSVTNEMWKNRIDLLVRWKAESPQSITPRVALAMAYSNYGWFARGTGSIDTVSERDYDLFRERLGKAEIELTEASTLGVKCPRLYREMLFVDMANGWSTTKFDEVYDGAISYEPNYLQFYLVKSEHLTPKWNGQPGEWRRFVDSLPSALALNKSNEVDLIYFVVVANKLGEQSLGINWAMISKERIKKGFQYLEEKYGADNFRLNQYARLAATTMDLESAKAAFVRIGTERDDSVWNEGTFNMFKNFAEKGLPELARPPAHQ